MFKNIGGTTTWAYWALAQANKPRIEVQVSYRRTFIKGENIFENSFKNVQNYYQKCLNIVNIFKNIKIIT